MIYIIMLYVKPTNGYRGVVIWGKTQKVGSQGAGKRISEVVPGGQVLIDALIAVKSAQIPPKQ